MNEDKKAELCIKMATQLPVLRKAMGASQTRFAELTGLTRSTVVRMERNKNMSWNTFLSVLMILSKHEETVTLLHAYHLYSDELEEYLSGKKEREA